MKRKILLSISLLLFLTGFASAATPIASYNFESSGPLLDQSGNNHDGTLFGPTTGVTGLNGSAYNFNETEGDFVEIDAFDLVSNNEYTISSWIKLEDLQDEGTETGDAIFTKPYGSSASALEFGLWDADGDGTLDSYRFGQYDGSQHGFNLGASGTTPEADSWVHVVGTFNGNTWRIYENATLVAEKSETYTLKSSSKQIYIGQSKNATPRFFDGKIDEVEFYRTALNSSEVTELYNEELSNSDTAPPELTIDYPVNKTISTSSPWVNASASEQITWENLEVDGVNQSYDGSKKVSGLSEGKHTVKVYASDSANNNASESQVFTVDTIAPDLISKKVNKTLDSFDIQFKFSEKTNLTLETNTSKEDIQGGFFNTHVVSLEGFNESSKISYTYTLCDKVGNCQTTESNISLYQGGSVDTRNEFKSGSLSNNAAVEGSFLTKSADSSFAQFSKNFSYSSNTKLYNLKYSITPAQNYSVYDGIYLDYTRIGEWGEASGFDSPAGMVSPDGEEVYMWFAGKEAKGDFPRCQWDIGFGKSTDGGDTWSFKGSPIIDKSYGVGDPTVWYNKSSGVYHMLTWATGSDNCGSNSDTTSDVVRYYTSENPGSGWTEHLSSPVMNPTDVAITGELVEVNGTFYYYYRNNGNAIRYYSSQDLVNWTDQGSTNLPSDNPVSLWTRGEKLYMMVASGGYSSGTGAIRIERADFSNLSSFNTVLTDFIPNQDWSSEAIRDGFSFVWNGKRNYYYLGSNNTEIAINVSIGKATQISGVYNLTIRNYDSYSSGFLETKEYSLNAGVNYLPVNLSDSNNSEVEFEFKSSSSVTRPFIDFLKLSGNAVNQTDTTMSSITIHEPQNQTYSSSSVDLNVTSSEPANYTHNVEYRNGTKVISNTTTNQGDTDLNITLSNLPDGNLTVNVWATDGAGNTGSASRDFSVSANSLPSASFTRNDSTPEVNETVSFDASGSSDSDGSISSYEWDWDGDGSYEGSGVSPSHTFSETGDFSVKLRITDNEGGTATVSKFVNVSINTSSQVFGLGQDSSKSSDTGTQYLFKKKEITNLGSGFVSSLSVSDPTIPGTCTNCGKTVSLQGSESKNVTYNSSGDWISGEISYSLDNASSSVEYGAFDTNYSSSQVIEVTNDRPSLSLSVKLDPAIPDTSQCLISSDTKFSIGAGSTENNSITKSCDPGDEKDYSLVKNVQSNSSVYEYNGTVEVYSDRTSEVKQEYWVKKSRFTDFSNKDASSVNYSIDGVTQGLDVSVKSRGGSDYLVWTAYTNRTNSSVHQGTHYFTYEYSVSDSSSGSGGSSGGSTGGSGGDQTQVTESPYDWGVTLVDSDFVGIFKPSVRPGQSFEREIVVNSEENDLTIDVSCESDGSACEWVSPGITTINFEDEGKTMVTIRGRVPKDAKKDTYRFNIAFTDPAHQPGSGVGKNTVRFVVSTESRWDFVFEYWNSLTGFYNGVPIAFFGFFMSMIFFVPAWALGKLEDYPRVVPTVAVLIFLITVGVI